MTTWLIYTGLLFLSISFTLQAQCPEREAVYGQLEQISSMTDAQARITALTKLEGQCRHCRMTADSVYAKILHVLGRNYWKAGDLTKGEAYTRKALAVNAVQSPLTNRANLSNSYNNLAQILVEQNKYRPAVAAFDQTLKIALQYPDHYKVAATSLPKYTNLLVLLGDYDQAVQRGQQGFELAQRIREPRLMVQNLTELSQAFIKLKKYDQANRALKKCLPIAETLNDPTELSNTLSLLGQLVAETQSGSAAVAYFDRAFRVHKQAGNRYGCAQALSSLANFCQTKQHNQVHALAYLQQAITYADDRNDRASLLAEIGKTLRTQAKFDSSLSYYQQALLTFSINFKQPSIQSNPSPEAIRLILQKEYLLTLMQDKADTWLDYAKATGSRQRLQHALATYRVADQMIDFMRWEHTGQQSKLFWRQKTRGMYERAIETCYQLGDAEQAFRFMEKSRAVMLADQLNELGARQQLAPAQVAQEQQLRQAVTDQQATLAGLTPDSSAYASARSELLNRQDWLGAFLKQLEASNPAYYRYKYDNTTPSLADLKARLSNQKSQFVSYFVGDSALYILSVSGSRDTLIRQPLGAYKQTVRNYMTLLANPDAMNQTTGMRQFLTLGNRLYRQLLAPLQLPAGRVIVSPDGLFVPFEALSRSATRADYAVTNQAFSYAYSAGLLLKKRSDAGRVSQFGQSSFLGVAPVQFASVLKQVSLPGSDEALKTIASRFVSPVLLMHEQASLRAFLDQTNRAQVVQLFTHATASDSTDAEPRLYFADSVLNLSDLNESLLQTELVVLAACKTGVGTNERGEGVFSLARGFAALGVPSVVTTLWNVENRATYAITTDFYRYLADGLPKDEALQQAKLNWLTTADGARQLPNYWAGLIVVGDTEPLKHATPWLWLAGGLGIVLAGAGSIWWWRRNRGAMPIISLLRPA